MKKGSHISFRTSKELLESLAQVAKEDRRSLSSTIERALTNYLKERKAFHGIEKEKRQYPRKALSVPAVINQQEPGKMGIGAITEISLGGVKVLIPKDFRHQIFIDSQGSRFEIVFNLPTENKPIRLSCESNRVVDAEDSIHVGALIVDADFKSYRALQTYLM
ncbi:MAG: PilZ domain-containing protein [Syntrophales bacterium]